MDNQTIISLALATTPRAAYYLEYKTLAYFAKTLKNLVRSLYNGFIGGDFVTVMADLIRGQIIDAYVKAWYEQTDGESEPPPYLQIRAQGKIDEQISMIQPYYIAILDARIDQTPIEPLLSRADLWAGRYQDAYNDATIYITEQTGGRMVWRLGATEKHCPLCSAYDGIVAFASEWSAAGIQPKNAPNAALTGQYNNDRGCEGWRCDCELKPTTEKRTRRAYDKLMGILAGKMSIKYSKHYPGGQDHDQSTHGNGSRGGGKIYTREDAPALIEKVSGNIGFSKDKVKIAGKRKKAGRVNAYVVAEYDPDSGDVTVYDDFFDPDFLESAGTGTQTGIMAHEITFAA
jgi:hypothetical protein